jgi:hypothetical protein
VMDRNAYSTVIIQLIHSTVCTNIPFPRMFSENAAYTLLIRLLLMLHLLYCAHRLSMCQFIGIVDLFGHLVHLLALT